MENTFKMKLMKIASSASGMASILGSYQICHNLCMTAVTALALIGITIIGMPLLFLQSIATPFWIIAAVMLAVMIVLKATKLGCISGNALLFNTGIIITGTPFLQQYNKIIWTIGGILVLISIIIFGGKKMNFIHLTSS